MDYTTIRVSRAASLCRVRLDRPNRDNTITDTMVSELHDVLDRWQEDCTIFVLEGTPEVFCHGADLTTYRRQPKGTSSQDYDPSPLYDLWTRMATGPFVTVLHARGTTTAGGVGFVAASDIVIADETATFSLSELLFGLYPAMVLPFLVRRVGRQRAHYLTLMTKPVVAQQAKEWGLVDVCSERSDVAVAQHITRLSKLPKEGIAAYKLFMNGLTDSLAERRDAAVAANRRIFSDPDNLDRITRFVEHGIYPWESIPSATAVS